LEIGDWTLDQISILQGLHPCPNENKITRNKEEKQQQQKEDRERDDVNQVFQISE